MRCNAVLNSRVLSSADQYDVSFVATVQWRFLEPVQVRGNSDLIGVVVCC